jgi:hypothetical protein
LSFRNAKAIKPFEAGCGGQSACLLCDSDANYTMFELSKTIKEGGFTIILRGGV